jgi:hypothetical protein
VNTGLIQFKLTDALNHQKLFGNSLSVTCGVGLHTASRSEGLQKQELRPREVPVPTPTLSYRVYQNVLKMGYYWRVGYIYEGTGVGLLRGLFSSARIEAIIDVEMN